ncbi:MAG: GumN superfamily protein, partial [Caulobacteraceae bacterium]|nr:GumN superfamily protein [Caulobacteraceae bacterium]
MTPVDERGTFPSLMLGCVKTEGGNMVRSRWWAGGLCLAACVSTGSAWAAPAPAASGGGPAWWRVSDADSEVWIIGTPDSMPAGVKFEEAALKEHLIGARTLIIPPPTDGDKAINEKVNLSKRVPPKLPLSKRLPPDLYAQVLSLEPKWKVWGENSTYSLPETMSVASQLT